MKVWSDEVGINVAWKRGTALRVAKQLVRKRTLAAAMIAIVAYLIFGQWLLDAIGAVALLAVVAAFTFVVFEVRKLNPHRLRPGELCLAELPGFVWILLAGPEYWKAAGRILERRARKAEVAVAAPKFESDPATLLRHGMSPWQVAQALGMDKHTARGLMYDLMGPLPGGYGPRRANCIRCGAPHPLVSGHCGPCYEYRRRRQADWQVIELARAGKRPAEIAGLLGVTPQTIRRIVQNGANAGE